MCEFKLIYLDADCFQASTKETVKNTDYIKVPNFPKTFKREILDKYYPEAVKPQKGSRNFQNLPSSASLKYLIL